MSKTRTSSGMGWGEEKKKGGIFSWWVNNWKQETLPFISLDSLVRTAVLWQGKQLPTFWHEDVRDKKLMAILEGGKLDTGQFAEGVKDSVLPSNLLVHYEGDLVVIPYAWSWLVLPRTLFHTSFHLLPSRKWRRNKRASDTINKK